MDPGSFWAMFGGAPASASEVLRRPSFALADVLTHAAVTQDMKSGNSELCAYFSSPAVLGELVSLLVNPYPRQGYAHAPVVTTFPDGTAASAAAVDHLTRERAQADADAAAKVAKAARTAAKKAAKAAAATEKADRSPRSLLTADTSDDNDGKSDKSDDGDSSGDERLTDADAAAGGSSSSRRGKPRYSPSQLPHLAAEVLTLAPAHVIDVIFTEPALLASIFSVLDAPAGLDPGAVVYACKVLLRLIQWRRSDVAAHVRDHALAPLLVRHIGLQAVMEAVIMLGWDVGTGEILDPSWLCETGFPSLLLGCFDPPRRAQPGVALNASRVLVDCLIKCPDSALARELLAGAGVLVDACFSTHDTSDVKIVADAAAAAAPAPAATSDAVSVPASAAVTDALSALIILLQTCQRTADAAATAAAARAARRASAPAESAATAESAGRDETDAAAESAAATAAGLAAVHSFVARVTAHVPAIAAALAGAAPALVALDDAPALVAADADVAAAEAGAGPEASTGAVAAAGAAALLSVPPLVSFTVRPLGLYRLRLVEVVSRLCELAPLLQHLQTLNSADKEANTDEAAAADVDKAAAAAADADTVKAADPLTPTEPLTQALCASGLLPLLLSLVRRHPWHSILHSLVDATAAAALCAWPSPLAASLVGNNGEIVETLTSALADSDAYAAARRAEDAATTCAPAPTAPAAEEQQPPPPNFSLGHAPSVTALADLLSSAAAARPTLLALLAPHPQFAALRARAARAQAPSRQLRLYKGMRIQLTGEGEGEGDAWGDDHADVYGLGLDSGYGSDAHRHGANHVDDHGDDHGDHEGSAAAPHDIYSLASQLTRTRALHSRTTTASAAAGGGPDDASAAGAHTATAATAEGMGSLFDLHGTDDLAPHAAPPGSPGLRASASPHLGARSAAAGAAGTGGSPIAGPRPFDLSGYSSSSSAMASVAESAASSLSLGGSATAFDATLGSPSAASTGAGSRRAALEAAAERDYATRISSRFTVAARLKGSSSNNNAGSSGVKAGAGSDAAAGGARKAGKKATKQQRQQGQQEGADPFAAVVAGSGDGDDDDDDGCGFTFEDGPVVGMGSGIPGSFMHDDDEDDDEDENGTDDDDDDSDDDDEDDDDDSPAARFSAFRAAAKPKTKPAAATTAAAHAAAPVPAVSADVPMPTPVTLAVVKPAAADEEEDPFGDEDPFACDSPALPARSKAWATEFPE